MKLKFNRDVRKSIADELKKVSTFGGIGLGVLGYSINAPLLLLGAFYGGSLAKLLRRSFWLWRMSHDT